MSENSNPVIRGVRNLLKPFGLAPVARRFYHRLQGRHAPPPSPSETSKCRARLAPFCVGYGLDLGFGGDPIVPHAIGMDMPRPYSDVGKLPVQLGGDATKLEWFRDGTLDFVFSSHLLEDFVDTSTVCAEWLRVLKPGGRLLIFCPDEQVYRKHCAATGQPYNTHHIHADFSLAFVKAAIVRTGVPTRVLHEIPLVDVYSWDLVVEKLPTPAHG